MGSYLDEELLTALGAIVNNFLVRLHNGQEIIYKKEPESVLGQRFIAGFVKLLPAKGQL